jgi:hypothetical protein
MSFPGAAGSGLPASVSDSYNRGPATYNNVRPEADLALIDFVPLAGSGAQSDNHYRQHDRPEQPPFPRSPVG